MSLLNQSALAGLAGTLGSLDLPPTGADHRAFIPPGVSTPGARLPQSGICFFPDINEVPAA